MENKYFKYKNKYLNLKKYLKINQLGGLITRNEIFENKEFLNLELPVNYKCETFKYSESDKSMYVLKIELNKEDKPVLFGLAGFSNKSFNGTLKIILGKLKELQTKFSALYFFEYDGFKNMQNDACKERDEILKKNNDDAIYKPEFDLNDKIADYINDIITNELCLTNVHLLGKCNGGWIVTLLLIKSDIYKGLYLGVPGIPQSTNYGINILLNSHRNLNNINFVFGWRSDDAYEFKWGISNKEKDYYDKIICENKPELKYISYMEDNGNKPDSKNNHEITSSFIDEILKSII